ncbi:MAG: serine/threonine protein kinase [Gemmataceae bacterium]|nr:serine/threonine protein kinase [Gemmataceae bacterium]
MGHVYFARHRRLGRPAAVKVLRPDRGDSRNAQARFLREVQTLGQLAHPNVIHAYDAGVAGRTYFLAMEDAYGPDLGQMLGGGPVPFPQACEYARQAALGLHHLHERGLVHRDVKPSNLRLGDDGRVVKLLDIGLVRDRDAEQSGNAHRLTQPGWVVGTMDYTSPEQVTDSREAGPAADQYGLGATLFHLLTGDVPFPGGTPVAKAVQKATADAPPVTDRRPDLPAGLAAVVSRMLSRDPDHRYPSAQAAADALALFAAPLPKGAPAGALGFVPSPTLPPDDTDV